MKPNAQSVAEHHRRALDKGLVRVHPWIPTPYREAVLSLCQGLREGDKVMVKLIERLHK